MEFNGSSGKWKAIFIEDNIRAIRNEGGIIMRFWKPCRYSGQDERHEAELKETQANQKNCLHARELLELLNQFVSISDELNVPDHLIETFANLYANAFNTIQEATTI